MKIFTVFSATVLFWMEEDTFLLGCGWLRDQICFFELADYWVRIQIHLRSVHCRVHGNNNYEELQDFFLWAMIEMHQHHSWALLKAAYDSNIKSVDKS